MIHPYKGAIFESFVISELTKVFANMGLESDIWFWRDRTGHEVDVLIETGRERIPIEIKASQTVSKHYFRGLDYWTNLEGNVEASKAGTIVYAGNTSYQRSSYQLLAWNQIGHWLAERL